MDICTSAILRGRYTRMCVEVPLGILIKTHIFIEQLKQRIIYEGADILCTSCSMIGHISENCTSVAAQSQPKQQLSEKTSIPKHCTYPVQDQQWHVVTFNNRPKNKMKKEKQPLEKGKINTQNRNNTFTSQAANDGINNVKMFYAD